jgi:hypothetical protein
MIKVRADTATREELVEAAGLRPGIAEVVLEFRGKHGRIIDVLIEAEKGSRVGRAGALQPAEVRAIVTKLAGSTRLDEVDRFAQAWHILMQRPVIAAGEGRREAAPIAKNMGWSILAGWPRRAGGSS